eukprot:m.103019 g.103019  ORF g.103019 m.103019 type:complete len:979 (+) comp12563_c0_seq3:193-3129(+)
MADHFGHLKRADSTQSLASLAGDRKFNKSGGGGALKLDIRFAPPGPKEKSKGAIHIKVEEGKQLSTTDPYVKLYLSKDGKDVKGTKQKTKAIHKRDSPVYGERFVYHLKSKVVLDETSRIQITVWSDGGKLGKNDCVGGMSFTLAELVKADKIGWFGLLPEWQGREKHQFLSSDVDLDPLLIPEPHVGPPPSPTPSLKRQSSRKMSRKEKKADKAKAGSGSDAVSGGGYDLPDSPVSMEPPSTAGGTTVSTHDTAIPPTLAAPDSDALASKFKKSPSMIRRAAQEAPAEPSQPPPQSHSQPTQPAPTPVTAAAPSRSTEEGGLGARAESRRSYRQADDALPPPPTDEDLPPTPQESPLKALGDTPRQPSSDSLAEDLPPGRLTRSNSEVSLLSVAQADVVSADVVAGQVFLEIKTKDRTTAKPVISIRVVGAQHLAMREPYVKLYLSKLGSDVKSTKKKTKRYKKDKLAEVCNPQYHEDFEYAMTLSYRPLENYRVQVSVWDHARRHANICNGGFSFAVQELFDRGTLSGWYSLLPYSEGRTRYEVYTQETPSAMDQSVNVPPIMPPAAPAPAPSVASTKDEGAAAPVARPSKRAGRKLPKPANPGLTRTDSEESITSVMSAAITSGTVHGDLHLYLKYQPVTDGKKGVYGKVEVTVNEGRDLAASDPYVKLYLSKDGSNIKSTKKKTRVQKKSKSPVFQETFEYDLNDKTPLEAVRVQITVWDHSRAKANECTGHMSFALTELARTTRTSGWFKLLPYKEGRVTNEPCAGRGSDPGVLAVEQPSSSGTDFSLPAATAAAPTADADKTSLKSSGSSKSGKKKESKKESKKGTKKNVAELQKRDEDHVREKANLHEKIQTYREQVEQMAALQARNLRLQNDLADAKASYERLESEKVELEDRVDELTTQNKRLNEFIILHKDDAEQRRDEIVVLRDCLGDQKDENVGLRSFITELQTELLKIDRKAFARALAAHQSSML